MPDGRPAGEELRADRPAVRVRKGFQTMGKNMFVIFHGLWYNA